MGNEKIKAINSLEIPEEQICFIDSLIEHILKEHKIPKEIFEIPRHPNYHNRFMELVRNPLVDRLIFRIQKRAMVLGKPWP